MTPSRLPKLPEAREKRWPLTFSSRVPPRTIWRPTPVPKAVSVSGFWAMSAKRVFERSPASPRRSTGSRMTPTPTRRAPVGPSASSIESEMSPGRPPRASDADPLAPELVADQDRVDAVGELVGAAQFAAELVGAVAGVLEVAGEAVLEVLAGVC